MKITLSRPIEAHGETLAELELREPTGEDIMECGMPFEFVDGKKGTRRHIDTRSMGAYISALASIPPSSVAKLHPSDFIALSGAVVGFFQQPAALPRK